MTWQITLWSSESFPHQNGWAFPFLKHPTFFFPSFSMMPTEKMEKKIFCHCFISGKHPAPWALHYPYCIPAVNAMSTPAATTAVIFTLMLQAMISTNTGEFQTSSWNKRFYTMTNCFSLSLSDQKVLLNTIWAGDKTSQNLEANKQ